VVKMLEQITAQQFKDAVSTRYNNDKRWWHNFTGMDGLQYRRIKPKHGEQRLFLRGTQKDMINFDVCRCMRKLSSVETLKIIRIEQKLESMNP